MWIVTIAINNLFGVTLKHKKYSNGIKFFVWRCVIKESNLNYAIQIGTEEYLHVYFHINGSIQIA